MAEEIYPKYKLLMTYDIKPGASDAYYQFIFQEFVPTLQSLGVYMTQAYHTAYGNYPVRHVEFVTEDIDTLQDLLNSEDWTKLKTKFDKFTTNYSHKIVEFREGFQF
jgi:hypothetical protein